MVTFRYFSGRGVDLFLMSSEHVFKNLVKTKLHIGPIVNSSLALIVEPVVLSILNKCPIFFEKLFTTNKKLNDDQIRRVSRADPLQKY